MILAASAYGPFASVVGYAGAIMATGAAIFYLWGRKMEKWRPPDEDLPGGAQAIVLLLCGMGMVLQWYLAVPESIAFYIGITAIFMVACVVCFLRYSGLLGTYVYVKIEPTGPQSVRNVRILGGRILLPDAEKKRQEHGVSIQDLFAGAAYDPDRLWDRKSRQWVKQRVLLAFILTLVLGTSALTGASFATQVLLSNKPATNVIHTMGNN